MIKKISKLTIALAVPLILLSCSNDNEMGHYKDYISSGSFIIDYSADNPRTQILKEKIANAKSQGLTIVQLGDSHTAADVMSMYTRNRLQQFLGKGAIGFIEPINVPGQYNSLIGFKRQNVSLINSRTQRNYDYAFGGIIASFNSRGSIEYRGINGNSIAFSELNLIARCTDTRTCTATISSNAGTSTLKINSSIWNTYSIFVQGDYRISANANLEVAGMYINNTNQGVTYSALGSNGATIYHLDAWNKNWIEALAALKPDLVILAYGTNESYNNNYNSNQYIADYTKLVKLIESNTQAQIMILSNPDSLNKNINPNLANVQCNNLQAATVDRVHRDLALIARDNKLLYWDWRGAMGGKCSALKLMEQGVMRADGVHFTAKGYSLFGYQLAHDIYNLPKAK
ncbi:hypothetical protein CJP74_05750 [Psittacicella melopsittaci]|uniref:Uncharacterized protein n=2 Tax=Psittacicella melopsittaci TaxID=2028576 RepID=A0A3A1Y188_9GAMM|nr:hypothetical protein CJP74_05750 [Psittacicella melopsittaci]